METPRFQRDSGTVAVLVHPNGTEEILKDSIPTEDGIRLTVDGSAMVKSINNSKDFIDVSADAYYAGAVSWAVENGITTGVGGGRFDPTGACTRAQIAAFLARLYTEK